MADPTGKSNTIETLFDQHLVRPPEGEDGIGPTLGEDVSAETEEAEDARHGVHSEDQGPGI
jgi:hypothetical protein